MGLIPASRCNTLAIFQQTVAMPSASGMGDQLQYHLVVSLHEAAVCAFVPLINMLAACLTCVRTPRLGVPSAGDHGRASEPPRGPPHACHHLLTWVRQPPERLVRVCFQHCIMHARCSSTACGYCMGVDPVSQCTCAEVPQGCIAQMFILQHKRGSVLCQSTGGAAHMSSGAAG